MRVFRVGAPVAGTRPPCVRTLPPTESHHPESTGTETLTRAASLSDTLLLHYSTQPTTGQDTHSKTSFMNRPIAPKSHTTCALALSLVFTAAAAQSDNKAWTLINTNGIESTGRRVGGLTGPIDGKLYLIGGRSKKPIDAFDPETNTWIKTKKQTNDIHHFQPVCWDDKIFIVCGLMGKYPVEVPTTHIFMYDPRTDKETGKFPLVEYDTIPIERRRGSAAVAVYKDEFYIVGGIVNGHTSGTQRWFDKYNPTSKKWTALRKKPRRLRDHAGAAVFEDKLWIAGGRVTNIDDTVFTGLVPELEYYDFKKKKWFPKKKKFDAQAARLEPPRAAPAVAFYHGMLWVIGGTTSDMINTTSIYNPAQDTWQEGPDLTVTRGATTALVHNDEIYIASGARTVQEDTNTIEKTMTVV